MGDLRNKIAKEQEAERIRKMQARYKTSVPPFVPVCDGCGLKGYDNKSPSGEFIRIYAVSGAWKEPDKVYCENCLEAHTGDARELSRRQGRARIFGEGT